METIDIRNIEDDRSAVLELQFALASAHARGIRLVAVRHGEGKRGILARRFLRRYKREVAGVSLLFGEDLRGEGSVARYFTERHDCLSKELPSSETAYLEFLQD